MRLLGAAICACGLPRSSGVTAEGKSVDDLDTDLSRAVAALVTQ